MKYTIQWSERGTLNFKWVVDAPSPEMAMRMLKNRVPGVSEGETLEGHDSGFDVIEDTVTIRDDDNNEHNGERLYREAPSRPPMDITLSGDVEPYIYKEIRDGESVSVVCQKRFWLHPSGAGRVLVKFSSLSIADMVKAKKCMGMKK